MEDVSDPPFRAVCKANGADLLYTEFISSEEENELLRQIANLEFRAFDFHGYIAKRRIVEYGFEYDFTSRQAQTASPTSISRCVQGTSRGMGRNSC